MVQGRIPIYEGGLDDSKVRQAKETRSQNRIQLDSARAQVRQVVISAWGQLDAARAQVEAAQAGVAADQLAPFRRHRGTQGGPADHPRRAQRAADLA